MTTDELPDPSEMPSIEDLDHWREHYGFSMNEFSRKAGLHETRWAQILQRGESPKLDTYLSFLGVIKNADPDGPRTQRGRAARCEVRGDGCGRGDD